MSPDPDTAMAAARWAVIIGEDPEGYRAVIVSTGPGAEFTHILGHPLTLALTPREGVTTVTGPTLSGVLAEAVRRVEARAAADG